MQNRFRILAGVMIVATVVAGCEREDNDENDDSAKAVTAAAPASDRAADEAAIRQLDDEFFAASRAKDANAMAAVYADDAISMPPNSPLLVGKAAIRSYNVEVLKIPQFSMTGESTSIGFSDDGTMAYDTGKYAATFADPKGKLVKDEGKYLGVLKKIDGKWRIVADAFNSNMAPGQ